MVTRLYPLFGVARLLHHWDYTSLVRNVASRLNNLQSRVRPAACHEEESIVRSAPGALPVGTKIRAAL